MASTFPPFEVWEDDDSYLVALQVPAIDRSTLEHKISIVGLEVSGSCSMPLVITKKWPGAFDWYPRKWQRQIVFPKPIDPNMSGLVDIQCEGMLFYKCPKQTIHTVNLTNTIKLQE
jgi:HSP20 family molecular chaperone IbpA